MASRFNLDALKPTAAPGGPLHHPTAALISRATAAAEGPSERVDVRHLHNNRFQPVSRRDETSDRVRELARTIAENGLAQPITARRVAYDAAVHGPRHDAGGGDTILEIIAGHGRTYAHRMLLDPASWDSLGLSETALQKLRAEPERFRFIGCVVRNDVSDVEASSLAAIENIARDNNPLDKAFALSEVKRVGGFTSNEQLAAHLGLSKVVVTKLLRLTEAPQVIRDAMLNGVGVEISRNGKTLDARNWPLEYTTALEFKVYYDAVLARARKEALADGMPKDRAERHAIKAAAAATEALLKRAAKGNWTRARVVDELAERRKNNGAGEGADGEHSGPDDGPEARKRSRVLYDHRGAQFVINLQNFGAADAADLASLADHLRGFLARVERLQNGEPDVAADAPTGGAPPPPAASTG